MNYFKIKKLSQDDIVSIIGGCLNRSVRMQIEYIDKNLTPKRVATDIYGHIHARADQQPPMHCLSYYGVRMWASHIDQVLLDGRNV
jgi:hypothetical protein